MIERLDLFLTELLDPVQLILELRFGAEIPSHGGLLGLCLLSSTTQVSD
jgi:hypothetical protein